MGVFNNIVGTVSLFFKKYSPEIFIGAGIVGTATAAVLGCRASFKAKEVIDNAKEKLKETEEYWDGSMYGSEEDVEKKKDQRGIYIQAGKEFIKLYSIPVILEAASIFAICKGAGKFRKANTGLAAAFATLSSGYAAYRERVAKKVGEDTERELYYGIETTEETVTVIDEDGKKKKQKKVVKTPTVSAANFARVLTFDNPLMKFTKDRQTIIYKLMAKERYLNDRLKARLFICLNDVYEDLEFEAIPEGQVLIWRYDLKHPTGDNRIDFGLKDSQMVEDFLAGKIDWLILDFNFDGPYYKMIGKETA